MTRTAKLWVVALVLLAGCKQSAAHTRWKFKDDSGHQAFKIKDEPDGAKLVDGQNQEVARIKWKGHDLKVTRPDHQLIGYLRDKGDKLELEQGQPLQVLYKLHRKPDGSYKVKDGAGTVIYAVKREANGAKVKDASGQELFKVRVHGAKVSLRTPDGRTRLSTKGGVSPEAMAVLGMEKIPIGLRAALLYRLAGGGK